MKKLLAGAILAVGTTSPPAPASTTSRQLEVVRLTERGSDWNHLEPPMNADERR